MSIIIPKLRSQVMTNSIFATAGKRLVNRSGLIRNENLTPSVCNKIFAKSFTRKNFPTQAIPTRNRSFQKRKSTESGLKPCIPPSFLSKKKNVTYKDKSISKVTQNPYQHLDLYVKGIERDLPNPYVDTESFLKAAKSASYLLPTKDMAKIESLQHNKLNDNYLLLKGLPLDYRLPKTPGLEFPPKPGSSSFVSEFCLSLVGCKLGEPFNFIQEENGNIFRNVRPTKKNEQEQTSDGSKVNLEFHTESAFHPAKPDFLLLYCLRGDRTKRAFTIASSLNKFLPLLDRETIDELRKEQFRIGIDVSFGNTDKTKSCEAPIAVIYGSEEDPKITYDLDLMVAPNDKSREALSKLKDAITKAQVSISLEPGDLLIIDNKRAIHGRTAFKAFYDGYDRWLQRVYVSKDSQFAANIPSDGRIITTQF